MAHTTSTIPQSMKLVQGGGKVAGDEAKRGEGARTELVDKADGKVCEFYMYFDFYLGRDLVGRMSIIIMQTCCRIYKVVLSAILNVSLYCGFSWKWLLLVGLSLMCSKVCPLFYSALLPKSAYYSQ